MKGRKPEVGDVVILRRYIDRGLVFLARHGDAMRFKITESIYKGDIVEVFDAWRWIVVRCVRAVHFLKKCWTSTVQIYQNG